MHYCIVGCGAIARVHARHLSRLRGARVSFASRTKDKAEAWRDKWRGVSAFASYEAAFDDPSVGTIVICTPHDSHASLALAALGAGKHVVIEKPIACTTADADSILVAAETANRQVLVAENHHYRPHVRRMADIARSGRLGKVKLIRIQILRNRRLSASEWRGDAAEMGGGAFIDGGIHWVNVLRTLAGSEPDHLTAHGAAQTHGGEDTLTLTCDFADGAIGVLAFSWGVRGAMTQGFFSVHGSEGSAYCSNAGRVGFLSAGGFPRPLIFPFRDWQGFGAMWQDFDRSLTGGSAAAMDGLAGRCDLAVVEAVYRQIGADAVRSS